MASMDALHAHAKPLANDDPFRMQDFNSVYISPKRKLAEALYNFFLSLHSIYSHETELLLNSNSKSNPGLFICRAFVVVNL